MIATLPEDVDDDSAHGLLEELLALISGSSARTVIVDVSALRVVDSFLGRIVADIANCASVLDARTVVCGISPSVAITLVELGVRFGDVTFALDMDAAMRGLKRRGIEDA